MPTGTPPIVTPGGITSGAGAVVVGDVVVPVEVEPVGRRDDGGRHAAGEGEPEHEQDREREPLHRRSVAPKPAQGAVGSSCCRTPWPRSAYPRIIRSVTHSTGARSSVHGSRDPAGRSAAAAASSARSGCELRRAGRGEPPPQLRGRRAAGESPTTSRLKRSACQLTHLRELPARACPRRRGRAGGRRARWRRSAPRSRRARAARARAGRTPASRGRTARTAAGTRRRRSGRSASRVRRRNGRASAVTTRSRGISAEPEEPPPGLGHDRVELDAVDPRARVEARRATRAIVPPALPRIATCRSGRPRSGGTARNMSHSSPVSTVSGRQSECDRDALVEVEVARSRPRCTTWTNWYGDSRSQIVPLCALTAPGGTSSSAASASDEHEPARGRAASAARGAERARRRASSVRCVPISGIATSAGDERPEQAARRSRARRAARRSRPPSRRRRRRAGARTAPPSRAGRPAARTAAARRRTSRRRPRSRASSIPRDREVEERPRDERDQRDERAPRRRSRVPSARAVGRRSASRPPSQ